MTNCPFTSVIWFNVEMVDSLVTLYVWFTLIRHGYQIFMLTMFSAQNIICHSYKCC